MPLRQLYGWVLAPINGDGHYRGTLRLALGAADRPPPAPLGRTWKAVYR